MQRYIFFLFAMLWASIDFCGMDFGLRFNSYDFPAEKRTSISIGETPFEFNKEFKLEFFFNFYATPMFGNIVTLSTNDSQKASLIGSRDDDGSFRLALVVNDSLIYLKTPITFEPTREDHIIVTLDKAKNLLNVELNDIDTEYNMDFANTGGVSAVFGMNSKDNQPDVAPIELRNVRIFIDGANTNYWNFKYHDTPTTTPDEIGGSHAVVANPHWLIDDHTDWKEIYALNTKNAIQTAFDPTNELIYIVDNDNIITFNPINGDTISSKINGGNRAMSFSNHLTLDPTGKMLINYNLNRSGATMLDLDKRIWDNTLKNDDEEPNYSNHAVALSGDTLYAFGGYGFYKYHNDLFTVNLSNGDIKSHSMSPAMMPLTSSAAAIVGRKLYIFGGRGNGTGRQELPAPYHYALYEYDIDSWRGEKLWEIDSLKYDFLPTQSMYYDVNEDCFYLGATCNGGQLLRISRTNPEINALSTPIRSRMDFRDFVFDLYRSNDTKRFYLVIDKRIDSQSHDLKIYTISAPFISDPQIINDKILNTDGTNQHESASTDRLLWGIVLAAIIVGLIFVFKFAKSKKATRIETKSDNADEESRSATEDFSFITLADQSKEPQFFDRSKASISFLGGFCVRDKEGNDITVKFTSRLKHLLILLLLSSIRYESGIKYQMIDEEIWSDKDDKSAQNNRNVSMRKLRMLLEEVGNVVISYDKGFFRIETNDVMFDYKELKTRMAGIHGVESVKQEHINEILELLLMGPMLPNTHYDWLDKYKAEFSNSALEILSRLLKYELDRDDNLAYRIAETISLHDMLNEEALFAKCKILSRRKMLGLAKNIHAKFCRDYAKNMGEEYPVSFAKACK